MRTSSSMWRSRRSTAAALLLAVLCSLFLSVGSAGTAAAAPSAPSAPSPSPKDEKEKQRRLENCKGPGLNDTIVEACQKKVREAWNEEHGGGSGADDEEGGAFDAISPDCKTAPIPAQPGRGSGGWFQGDGPKKPAAPYDPDSSKYLSHLYERDGLAAMDWYTYDLDCKSPDQALSAMDQSVDNKIGSWLLGAARWWSSLAAELQKHVADDGYVREFTGAASDVVGDISDGIYKPWLPISVGILGLGILFGARKADWAGTMQKLAWALGVLTLTAITIQYPQTSSQIADDTLVKVTSTIQQSIAGDPNDNEAEAGTSAGNLTASTTLYDGWARGVFGDSTSKVAEKYGPRLYDAQSLTWQDSKLPDKERERVFEAKSEEWEKTAAAVKKEDPDAYEYLTGKKSARAGAGFEIAFSSIPSNTLSIVTASILACAREILILVVVFMPVIALLALHKTLSGTLRSIGKGAGAAMINAPLFAVGTGVYQLMQRNLLDGEHLPSWLGVILLWILFVMIWVILKPFRSFNSMVTPGHHWFGQGVGVLGKGKSALAGAAVGYATRSMSARQIGRMVNGPGQGRGRGQGQGQGAAEQTQTIERPGEADTEAGTVSGYQTSEPQDSWRDAPVSEDWWAGPVQPDSETAHDLYRPAPQGVDVVPANAPVATAPAPAAPTERQDSSTAPVPAPAPAPSTAAPAAPAPPEQRVSEAAGSSVPSARSGQDTPPHAPPYVPPRPAPAEDHPRPAPFVAPAVREEDGTTTYTIYNPTHATGYETRRDDLSDSLSGDE